MEGIFCFLTYLPKNGYNGHEKRGGKRLHKTGFGRGMFDTMTTFNDIYDAAQTLPAADQLRLIEAIWNHLPPSEWSMPDEVWGAESQRRSAAYDAGTMSASSWPDVQVRARKRAGLNG